MNRSVTPPPATGAATGPAAVAVPLPPAFDVHSHYIPARALEKLPPLLRDRISMREEGDSRFLAIDGRAFAGLEAALFDLDRQLADLAPRGLAGRALMPPPFMLLYDLPAREGALWSRHINEAMAEAAAQDAARLRAFATLPLQSPPDAVAELIYAVEQLGMAGVELGTNVGGRGLDEAGLDELFDAAETLDVPLFLHPESVLGLDRLSAYELRNLVGNPFETTVAAARLLFGGVMQRHPKLTVILSHGGGALPYLLGRLTHGWRQRLRRHPDEAGVERHLGRFYVDTVLFDPRALRYAAGILGAGRLLLGTDYPFDMSDGTPLATLQSALSEEEVRGVLDQTARLMRFPRPFQS